ncbi:unnamed protein product [Protopolystoma xenopodis]|uniref:G-patch domain-containing protein n=1 Tax=Protopolystoma xenopodis TaxID=117903 RepID=A0A448WPJ6_9PLAT|nr:unnamed protein product [Protopolystoma xenopodis]
MGFGGLLMKRLGWSPGQALGPAFVSSNLSYSQPIGLLEPLAPTITPAHTSRAGLGFWGPKRIRLSNKDAPILPRLNLGIIGGGARGSGETSKQSSSTISPRSLPPHSSDHLPLATSNSFHFGSLHPVRTVILTPITSSSSRRTVSGIAFLKKHTI